MLLELAIENLILIEKATITFSGGFTAITGETGAGKTALVHALGLLMGERADYTKIRKGAEKTVIRGVFEGLTIRRELLASGKSKAFLNDDPVSLNSLQELAPSLFCLVDQHSHVALRNEEVQGAYLDLFAETGPFLAAFREKWEVEKKAKEHLSILEKQHREKETLLLIKEHQKTELEKANLNECDEKTHEMLEIIDERLLPPLRQLNPSLPIKELPEYIKGAVASLEEASLALTKFQSSLEAEPDRLAFLEERLSQLSKLKKKHGKTIEELATWEETLNEEIQTLSEIERTLPEAIETCKKAQLETNRAAEALTEKRKKGAETLAPALSSLLRSLNMPSAEVAVLCLPISRSITGDEKITFFLKANQGESIAPLSGNISGGELARLLFALIILLAEKNPSSTLLFDEIDSGVGGETASLMAEKLLSLARCRQVLAITHFSQVAQRASHHIGIVKEEHQGRTWGQIKALSPSKKEEELLRMQGRLLAESK